MQNHKSSCLASPLTQARIRRQPQASCSLLQDDQPLPETAGKDDPEFRADLVARVRRQIADGTYGTEEQWEIALDRLMQYLDEMG